jgi:hypothetical protein
MVAAARFECIVALLLLCASCEKKREGAASTQFLQSDAGIDHGGINKPGSWERKGRTTDGGEEAIDGEAALREQFMRASFIACNDPDAGLAMMRRIHEESPPGSALQREAQWFIDQLTGNDAGTSHDGGL